LHIDYQFLMKLATHKLLQFKYYTLASAKPNQTNPHCNVHLWIVSGSNTTSGKTRVRCKFASAANIPSRVTSIIIKKNSIPLSLSLSVHANSLTNQYALLPWRLEGLPARAGASRCYLSGMESGTENLSEPSYLLGTGVVLLDCRLVATITSSAPGSSAT